MPPFLHRRQSISSIDSKSDATAPKHLRKASAARPTNGISTNDSKLGRTNSDSKLKTLSRKPANNDVAQQVPSHKMPRGQSMPMLRQVTPKPAAAPKPVNNNVQNAPVRRQPMPMLSHAPPQPVVKRNAEPKMPRRQSMPTLGRAAVTPVSTRPRHQESSDLLNKFFPKDSSKNLKALKGAFPNAIPITELVGHTTATLAHHGYGSTTLLATSLCCDEVNRDLERAFEEQYGDHFSMGGLAGLPFGGVTSFNAMAHHIPDGGSCLLVYGSHVGIDRAGNIGTVERRGRLKSGSCCGSAAAAASYVCAVHNGLQKADYDMSECIDIEQYFVGQTLLPHAKRLDKSKHMASELPYVCYEETHKRIDKIVEQGCREVAGNGRIALLGGIQINTPFEQEDYFLPLNFEIRTNRGEVINTFDEAFSDEAEIMA